MATRVQRMVEFTTNDEPPSDCEVELLCEDHVGTYVLPFSCRRVEGAWLNTCTGDTVQAKIVGWRPWELTKVFSRPSPTKPD